MTTNLRVLVYGTHPLPAGKRGSEEREQWEEGQRSLEAGCNSKPKHQHHAQSQCIATLALPTTDISPHKFHTCTYPLRIPALHDTGFVISPQPECTEHIESNNTLIELPSCLHLYNSHSTLLEDDRNARGGLGLLTARGELAR